MIKIDNKNKDTLNQINFISENMLWYQQNCVSIQANQIDRNERKIELKFTHDALVYSNVYYVCVFVYFAQYMD